MLPALECFREHHLRVSDDPAPVTDATPAEAPVAAEAPARPVYPPAAGEPTQQGPEGIRYDFNLGARVQLPEGRGLRVRLRDLDTGNILFESGDQARLVTSAKRYFVRFRVEVFNAGGMVMEHDYDARGREVLVQLPVGTLGDTLGWFPYAARFAEQHGCRMTCAMAEAIIPLLRDAYPHIAFLPHEAVDTGRYYATYSLGLFFDDTDTLWQPCDFRHVGLHRTAGYILGVDPAEAPPRLGVPDEGPPIGEPYACIAVQSSSQCKYWNNPTGWREVVRYLKAQGLRVICIDQKPVHGHGLVWTHLPYGAEDETGDRPLAERVRWLRHARVFVGLSSGLSWLAWAAGAPVVMISGFTHPTNEFATPGRVINYHACNGCWNDPRHRFDHQDFLWCPRHAGTARQFECTRLITAEQVTRSIARLAGFDVAA
jgi:autotransporter strand-loop-strand O-heptosyltransferase